MIRRCTVWLRGAVGNREVMAAMQVLGFSGPAPKDTIRKQYLELTRRFHPDVNDGNEEKMAAINAAYELVQENHHLLSSQPSPDGENSPVAPFKRSRSAKSSVVMTDEEEWHTKSEFDWSAAVSDVSDADLKNAHYQPFAHNRFFSFDDDATIYRMIRDGATVKHVARALGQRPVAIERRLANPQFKLRIQYLLRKNRNAPRDKREKTAAEKVVYREPKVEAAHMTMAQRAAAMDLGFDQGDVRRPSVEAWSADNVVSKLGRSYSHFSRFNKKR